MLSIEGRVGVKKMEKDTLGHGRPGGNGEPELAHIIL